MVTRRKEGLRGRGVTTHSLPMCTRYPSVNAKLEKVVTGDDFFAFRVD
jgi:hypothetical protein